MTWIRHSPDGPLDRIRVLSAPQCEGHGPAVLQEAQAMGEIQTAELIAFVSAIAALLLVLEVGLRRTHRRR